MYKDKILGLIQDLNLSAGKACLVDRLSRQFQIRSRNSMEAKNDTSDYKFSVKNKKRSSQNHSLFCVSVFSSGESGEHNEE